MNYTGENQLFTWMSTSQRKVWETLILLEIFSNNWIKQKNCQRDRKWRYKIHYDLKPLTYEYTSWAQRIGFNIADDEMDRKKEVVNLGSLSVEKNVNDQIHEYLDIVHQKAWNTHSLSFCKEVNSHFWDVQTCGCLDNHSFRHRARLHFRVGFMQICPECSFGWVLFESLFSGHGHLQVKDRVCQNWHLSTSKIP